MHLYKSTIAALKALSVFRRFISSRLLPFRSGWPYYVFFLSAFLATAGGCGKGLCVQCDTSALNFTSFMSALLHRNKGATQVTIQNQSINGIGGGYRTKSLVLLDDDGTVGGNVTFATRPTQSCGTTQNTIASRINDCASRNGSTSTWDGSVNGNGAQSSWSLVTFNGVHEVWRDNRTGILWSDNLGNTTRCRAIGTADDPSGYCNSPAYQDQTTPESWCREETGSSTPTSYDSMKGGMRSTATSNSPSVSWRLPTKWDFHMAEIDGVRFVLPGLGAAVWSSTIYSPSRAFCWTFDSTDGSVNDGARRDATASVRCIAN